jgi:ferredoxin
VNDVWRVDVDRSLCAGTGLCAGTAPAHFRLVDGVSAPLQSSTAAEDQVLDAAMSCPMEAISIRDTATGQALAP